MPMPPPRPSTERRDRVLAQEIGQIARALRAEGPQSSDDLAQLVGARFWDPHQFERAMQAAISGGRVVQHNDGRYGAV